MNKLIKNPLERMQKGTVVTLSIMVMAVFTVGCASTTDLNNENDDHLTSLEGTKWKLAGIVNAKTGVLKILEPKNCENCYTLAFDNMVPYCEEDILSSFSTYSSTNKLGGCYTVDYAQHSIHIFNFGGTKIGENGDGNLWWDIFPIIEYFSLQKNQLRLYYNGKNNYLLFKQIQP